MIPGRGPKGPPPDGMDPRAPRPSPLRWDGGDDDDDGEDEDDDDDYDDGDGEDDDDDDVEYDDIDDEDDDDVEDDDGDGDDDLRSSPGAPQHHATHATPTAPHHTHRGGDPSWGRGGPMPSAWGGAPGPGSYIRQR